MKCCILKIIIQKIETSHMKTALFLLGKLVRMRKRSKLFSSLSIVPRTTL